MTRRAGRVCIHVSRRICVALCERNSRQVRAYERLCAAGTSVSVSCVCLLLRGRKRDDPQTGSRGDTNKREKRNRRKSLGEKENGVEEEDGGCTMSYLKPERPLLVRLSLSSLSLLLFTLSPPFLLSYFLPVSFSLPWGL